MTRDAGLAGWNQGNVRTDRCRAVHTNSVINRMQFLWGWHARIVSDDRQCAAAVQPRVFHDTVPFHDGYVRFLVCFLARACGCVRAAAAEAVTAAVAVATRSSNSAPSQDSDSRPCVLPKPFAHVRNTVTV